MFNHEAYQRRLDEIRAIVKVAIAEMDAEVFQAWQKDVGLRYARFLAERAMEQLQRAVATLNSYEIVEDKQKHREYCAAELMGVVSAIHAASAMVRGAVVSSDSIGAEAMMRIYKEANEPQAQAPAGAAH